MDNLSKILIKGTTYALKDATARESIERLESEIEEVSANGGRLKGIVKVYPYTLTSGWAPDTTKNGMVWPLSEMPADGDLYAMPFGGTPLVDNEGNTMMVGSGRPLVKGDIYRYDAEGKGFKTNSPLFDGVNLTGAGSAGDKYDTYIAGEDMPENKAAAFGLSSAIAKGDLLVWDGSAWLCFSNAVDTVLDEGSGNAIANSTVTTELNKMYKKTYSMSASPSIVETGVEAEITLTYTAKSETYGGVTTKYTVSSVSKLNTDNGSDVLDHIEGTSNGYTTHKLSLTPATNGSHTIYSTVKLSDGTEKSLTAKYSSQHYMYFGSNDQIPLGYFEKAGLVKQPLANSPAKNGVKVDVTAGEYLFLCVPENMSISLVKDANTNIEIEMYSYTPQEVSSAEAGGNVTYNVYFSKSTMNETETLTLNIA